MSSSDWLSTEWGKRFTEAAFKAACLPETEENELEPGTYTNQELARRAGTPERLLALLTGLPDKLDVASKRSVLSFAVEMLESDGGIE